MNAKRPRSNERTGEVRLNVRFLPVFCGLLAIFYLLTGYRGWLVFFIGMAGAWLLAVIWVYSLKRGMSIERKIHLAWATVGDSVHEQLQVVNKSRLPALWVEIFDVSTTLAAPLHLVSDVEPRANRTRHPDHLFKRRGLYRLGPTRLLSSDPFGIYTLTIQDPHADTILVTPPVLSLQQLKISPGGWAGDQKRQQGLLDRNISDGIRPYYPGDSLKRIHWHATAHQDSLVVRQLEAASSGDWWIFVDLQADIQAGSGQDNSLELSIVLAASLAMRGLRERRRVGLAMAGPQLTWLEPHAGPAHRWQLLRALAMAEPGDRSLSELVTLGRPAQTAKLIIITPTCEPTWVASAIRRKREGNLMALLIDPAEFGGSGDQNKLKTALVRAQIPHQQIPRSVLAQAYPALRTAARQPAALGETGKRYLQKGEATWQSMD